MTSSSRFAGLAVLFLALAPLAAACGGEALSVGSDALKNGDGGGGGAIDGSAPCKTAAECGPDAVCGFASGAKCGDFGTCFSTKGLLTCAAYSPGCACDGTTVNVACDPVPSGYTTAPIVHAGACTAGQADASAPCTSDTECGPQGVCGFPRVDACTAKGFCFPKSGASCDGIEPGCACDGTFINLACNYLPSTHAPKPFSHVGACVDGG